MDAQVTLLTQIVTNVQSVVEKLTEDVALIIAQLNTGVDANDEAAITAANQNLQALYTKLQALDLSLQPPPAPTGPSGTTGPSGPATGATGPT